MEIKSHNSKSGSLARQLFVPSLVQVILYTLTSLVILSIANIRAIWEYLNGSPVGRQYSADLFGQGGNEGILGSSFGGRLGQIVVWGLLGVLIYTVIWFLKNIITNLRNDIVADEYIHPHSYSRANYWKSIAFRKGFFVLLLAVLAGYIYLCFKLFPVLSNIYLGAITNFGSETLINAVGAVVATTLLLHIFVALAHLAINSWQFIHADL